MRAVCQRTVPEQGQDLFTLLCDDQHVLSFEVPHGKVPLEAEEFVVVRHAAAQI